MDSEDKSKAHYITIPDFILLNKRLTRLEHELFGLILCLSLNEQGLCTATNEYLGNALGISEYSISNNLTHLVRAGIITRLESIDFDTKKTYQRLLWPNVDNKEIANFILVHYPDTVIAKKILSKGNHQAMNRGSLDNESPLHQVMNGQPLDNGSPLHYPMKHNNIINNIENNKDNIIDNNSVVLKNLIQISDEQFSLLYKEFPRDLVSKKIDEYKSWKEKVKPKNIKSDYEQLRKWLLNAKSSNGSTLVKQCNVDEVTDEQLKNINF